MVIETQTKTLKLRLKDKCGGFLREQARAVNFVWNFCNELSVKHFERKREFMSAYDMQPYTKGASAELGLHSQTVQAVQEEYCTRRKQFKKVKLRWRTSRGSRRSLGWIPFKASALSYKNGQVWYAGKPLSLWDSYGLAKYKLGTGSFSEDARGRWYLNVTVEVVCKPEVRVPLSRAALGIDLGLKEFLTDSEGNSVAAQKFYRDMQDKLATAQRANKKQRVRAIHAKIANRRKDFLHKLSTQQVKEHCAIFVGDVNAAALAKTTMAKSVLDAGWSTYRTMLRYKKSSAGGFGCEVYCSEAFLRNHWAGTWFKEVDERYSTQECHVCHQRSGPKGRAELDVRSWTCEHCGTKHLRDHNAAINIRDRGLAWLEQQFADTKVLRGEPQSILNKAFEPFGAKVAAGRGRLAEGILALKGGEDVKTNLTKCRRCRQGQLDSIERTKLFYPPTGHPVEVKLLGARCNHCGKETVLASQFDENLRRQAARKVAYGEYLLGEDIFEFRRKWGLTQQDFSKIFGKGVSEFSRYETEKSYPGLSLSRLLTVSMLQPSAFKALADSVGVEIPFWKSF